MKHSHHHSERSGAVLLLSLLLMASITASTIGISILITSTYRQASNTDRFISAGLAADTGIERGLAIIKTARVAQTLDEARAAAQNSATVLPSSRASWTLQSAQQDTPIPTTLQAGESFLLDILKNTAASPPDHLEVVASACSSNCGTLQVSWTIVTTDGSTRYAGRDFKTNVQYASGVTINLTNVYLDDNNTPAAVNPNTVLGYRVKLTSVGGAITNLQARPCTTGGGLTCTLYAPNGALELTSTGRVSDIQAQKKASVLWQLPSSGVFNFVLFTEGQIVPPS